jgi:hypothetical protein
MHELLRSIETSPFAESVGASLMLTAVLSAVHALGFTVATGGALVANLRGLRIALSRHSSGAITATASRIIAGGLVLSIVTGALLVAPRAASAAENGFFQTKMLLLLAAAAFHFTAQRGVAARGRDGSLLALATAAVGFALWTGLALAACGFILLE